MHCRAALLIFLLLATPATAQTDVCHSAARLLAQAKDNLGKGGVANEAALAPDMEQALAGAPACFPSMTNADGSTVILADGLPETLMATGMMATKKVSGSAQFNPFQQLALLLGSYYNEVGKPQDALRTLNQGLALSPFPEMRLGAIVHMLISEKGAALNALKRFDDAVQDYDEGLKLTNLADADRARLQRGRGFSFTELGRLDDAENAYREALKISPTDARALHELAYIARLRAGSPKASSYLSTVPPPAPNQDVPAEQRAKSPASPN